MESSNPSGDREDFSKGVGTQGNRSRTDEVEGWMRTASPVTGDAAEARRPVLEAHQANSQSPQKYYVLGTCKAKISESEGRLNPELEWGKGRQQGAVGQVTSLT